MRILLLSILLISIRASATNDDRIVEFPGEKTWEQMTPEEIDTTMRDVCAAIMDTHFPDVNKLTPGQVSLRDGEPVLILSGSYKIGGRISNFFTWRKIFADHLAVDEERGYDNENRFQKLPEGSRFRVELRQAVERIVPPTETPTPGVYKFGSDYVLLAMVTRSDDQRVSANFVRIDRDGYLRPGLEQQIYSATEFAKKWRLILAPSMSIHHED